jgi:hypothetical protein
MKKGEPTFLLPYQDKELTWKFIETLKSHPRPTHPYR